MPQRRSFGSGCSWREHPINKPTTLPSTSSTSSSNNTVGIDDNQSINKTIDDNNNEPTINWSCGTPRIIDHIPYRSRQANEWKETKGHNWRKDRNTDEVMIVIVVIIIVVVVVVIVVVIVVISVMRKMMNLNGCHLVRVIVMS